MAYQVNNRKIAKNTIVLYIRLGITMLISFFTVRVTLEQLGVEDYGLNNLVSSIVSLLTFLNGSMGTAVQRFYSFEIGKKNEEGLSRVFGVGLTLHGIVAILSFIIAEVFAIFFLEKMNIPDNRMWAAQIVFQLSILSLVINILIVPYSALLRARELFSQTAVIEILQSVLRLVFLYLLLVINYDKLVVLAFLNFSVTIFYVTLLTLLARKLKETHVRPLWDKTLVRQMLMFISMLIVTVLVQLVHTQGIVFLINLFFGLAINSAYAIAIQVSNIVNGFIINFKQAAVPQMMASYGSGDVKTMHHLINSGTKITYLLLLLLSLPVIFESNFLLTIWLKNPPEYSSQLVSLILIYINISSLTYFHYQGVHATGNITRQQTFMSIMYLVNIIFVWLAFKVGFNFLYAIYVNIVFAIIQCTANLYFAQIIYNYSVQNFIKSILFPSILVAGIASGAMAITVGFIEDGWIEILIVCIVDIIFVPLLGYLLLFNRQEKIYILNYINKISVKVNSKSTLMS